MALTGRSVLGHDLHIFSDVVEAGNIGTGEDDLMNFTLVPDELAGDSRGMYLKAWGKLAANGNSKTIRIRIGGVQVFSRVTTGNNVSWEVEMYFLRITNMTQTGTVHSCIDTAVELITFASTVDLMTALIVKLTADATTTDDVTQEGMVVQHI